MTVAGTVLWMDPSENHQQCSDPELVRATFRQQLDPGVRTPERPGPCFSGDETEP